MESNSDRRDRRYATRTQALLLGRDAAIQQGFVNMPIFRGSTVIYESADDLLERRSRFRYGSKGTPTTEALESAWTNLTGAAGTVLTPSGSAACALALMSCLSAGDHALITDSVYRPTRDFCDNVLTRYGIDITYYDPLVGSTISELMKDNTKVLFTESPGSQTFEVQDIAALAAAAAPRQISLLMDNTWATPFFFPAHQRGVDIAINAGTKYLGGHSDLLLGLVSANATHIQKLRTMFDALSISAGPEDVFLALRGLRTMHLRLAEQQASAIAIAQWLERRPEVKRVLHPALPSFEGHEIWKRDFFGASGLFSIVLKPVPQEAVNAMLDELCLFRMGYSWGGYESLIVPFDCNTHRTVTTFDAGGPCLRLQVGLEHIDDLTTDLDAGFAALKRSLEQSGCGGDLHERRDE